MDILTRKEESFCLINSIFGILIAATALIQHMTLMTDHWVAFLLIAVYILPIIAYSFLMRKSNYALVLLWISLLLVFAMELLLSYANVFSVIILFLLMYLIVTVLVLQLSGIHILLKKKYIAEKQEEDHWADKI
jgi:hypothetical protein